MTFGVRVEDDDAVVTDNEFVSADAIDEAIVVGTRYRTEVALAAGRRHGHHRQHRQHRRQPEPVPLDLGTYQHHVQRQPEPGPRS